MVDFLDKERCCGCEACCQICPMSCIEIKCDEEGFYYPEYNYNTKHCTECGLCEVVCPVLSCERSYSNDIH